MANKALLLPDWTTNPDQPNGSSHHTGQRHCRVPLQHRVQHGSRIRRLGFIRNATSSQSLFEPHLNSDTNLLWGPDVLFSQGVLSERSAKDPHQNKLQPTVPISPSSFAHCHAQQVASAHTTFQFRPTRSRPTSAHQPSPTQLFCNT